MIFRKIQRVPNEQPPTDDRRLREWLSRLVSIINGVLSNLPSRIVYDEELSSETYMQQLPLNNDLPTQISFGPGGKGDYISCDANGTLFCISNSEFIFNVDLGVSKPGVDSNLLLVVYAEINGVIVDNIAVVCASEDNFFCSYSYSYDTYLMSGDSIKFYMNRDAISSSGGLDTMDFSNVSMLKQPSASISVRRVIME